MFYYRFFWALLILVIFGWSSSADSHEPFPQQKMCLDFQGGDRFVLVVGMLSTRIVLITTRTATDKDIDNYYLYILAPDALNTATNQLYLNGGSWLKSAMPQLYHMFVKYYFTVTQIATLQVGGSGCVYMPTPRNGLAYDIDRQQVVSFKNVTPINVRWISCAEKLSFYGIKAQKICKFQFILKDSTGYYNIEEVSPYYSLCQMDDEDHISMMQSGCSRMVIWNIKNGFADGSRMYLFESAQVRIFELAALSEKLGDSVPVTTVPLQNFIHCAGQPMNSATPMLGTLPNSRMSRPNNSRPFTVPGLIHTTAGSSTALIVIGVVFLLIIIIVPAIVAFSVVFCVKNTRSQNQSAQNQPPTPMASESSAKQKTTKAKASKKGRPTTKMNKSARKGLPKSKSKASKRKDGSSSRDKSTSKHKRSQSSKRKTSNKRQSSSRRSHKKK